MNRDIGLASDHGGKILKDKILRYLREQGHSPDDFGVASDSTASVDYPDYAAALCQRIAKGELQRGILVCGSGVGMSIAANKIPGIRAALVTDEYVARMCRLHNDSNVLCLGERVVNHDRALEFVAIWLSTAFEGGRHQNRLNKIKELE